MALLLLGVGRPLTETPYRHRCRGAVRVATFSTLLVKQTRKQICNRDYWTRDQVSTYWRSIFDMLFDGGDRKPSDQTSPPLKTHS